MAKSDADEIYENVLLAKLQQVIDFLKFAETKNATLLTLASALSVAIGSLLLNERLPLTIAYGLRIALPIVMAAGVVAIASFMPRLCLQVTPDLCSRVRSA